MRVVEVIVVVLCTPFYLAVWPFMAIGHRKAHARIASQLCTSCGGALSSIAFGDIKYGGVKLALSRNANVKWDRLPQWSLNCPICNAELCFDREYRPTACDLSDALSRKPVENQP